MHLINPLHLRSALRASRDAWADLNAKAAHYDELAGYYQQWRDLAEERATELDDLGRALSARDRMVRDAMQALEGRDRRMARLDRVIDRQSRYVGQLTFERDYLLGERVRDLRPADVATKGPEQWVAEAAWATAANPSLGRDPDPESSAALTTWQRVVEANPHAAELLAEPSGAWPIVDPESTVPEFGVEQTQSPGAVQPVDGEDIAAGLLLVHLDRMRVQEPAVAADVDEELLGPAEDARRCVAPWNGRRCPQMALDGTWHCADHPTPAAATDDTETAGAAA